MDRLSQLLEFQQEDPNDAFTLYAIALEYLNIDKTKAQSYFEQLMHQQPTYLGTYYQLGTLLQEKGEKDYAEKVFRQGIEYASKSNNTHTLAELRSALNNMLLGLDD